MDEPAPKAKKRNSIQQATRKRLTQIKKEIITLYCQQVEDHKPLVTAMGECYIYKNKSASCHRDVKIVRHRMQLRQRRLYALTREYATLIGIPSYVKIAL